jgi:hypothetical protein
MSASGTDEQIATIAREADPSFSFVHPDDHYDGVYFYAIARDPLARGVAHRLIDRPAYRYGHPGYGWLAWIASAGRARAVPIALLTLGLVGAGLAGFAGSALATELGRSAWLGLIVGASPGVVYSVTADISEPVGLAAALLGLLAWYRRRWLWVGVAFSAACLIKEPLALVPIGLLGWEGIRRLRGLSSNGSGRRLVALAVGPLLLVLWYAYVTQRFGVVPFHESQELLHVPVTGWIDTFFKAAKLSLGDFAPMQIGAASIALLAVVAGALVAGLVRSVKLRFALDPVFFLLILLASTLGWLQLLYPKDMLRELTPQIALLPFILAGPGDARDGGPGGDGTMMGVIPKSNPAAS